MSKDLLDSAPLSARLLTEFVSDNLALASQVYKRYSTMRAVRRDSPWSFITIHPEFIAASFHG